MAQGKKWVARRHIRWNQEYRCGNRSKYFLIIITEGERAPQEKPQRVAIYARVSLPEHQANLDRQAEQLLSYCAAKGYQVGKIVKEIASGVNDSRPKLLALLEDQAITLIVVEQKDRLTRFGFRFLDTLLRGQGRALEVVNEAGNETEELLADLTSILYAFCARLYGQRRAKRKTETVIRTLEAGESGGEHATG